MLLNLVLTLTHLPGFHLLFSMSGFPSSLSVSLNRRWGNRGMGTGSSSVRAMQWHRREQGPLPGTRLPCVRRAGDARGHTALPWVRREGLSSRGGGRERAVGMGRAGEHRAGTCPFTGRGGTVMKIIEQEV